MTFNFFSKKEEEKEHQLIQRGYRYALSLCHQAEDAEDLVQQAWLKLCQKYKKTPEPGYLFKTIRNLYFDQWRRKQVLQFQTSEGMEETVGQSQSNLYAKQDLESLMMQLSDEQRETLYLNAVEGYTVDEISELVGLSRGTITSRLARAKQKLKELIEKEQPQMGGE